MSGSQHKTETKRFKGDENSVRQILNEWNPIPGSPDDEYDCLVHHILSAIHRGSREADLIQIIKSEMVQHFGVEESDRNIATVVEKLSEWWRSKATK
jgi:hypothetical protein